MAFLLLSEVLRKHFFRVGKSSFFFHLFFAKVFAGKQSSAQSNLLTAATSGARALSLHLQVTHFEP